MVSKYDYGNLSQDYRLKILRLDATADQQKLAAAKERLRWEFTALKRIENVYGTPYCDRIIDDGEQMVLPIRAPKGRRLSVSAATLETTAKLQILQQTCEILQQIHQSKVFHRSLVAQNIFVDDENNVELHDFTFAKQGLEQRTISPIYQGVSPWAAPELIKNPADASAESDTFAFAVLASKLLDSQWPEIANTSELLKDANLCKGEFIFTA